MIIKNARFWNCADGGTTLRIHGELVSCDRCGTAIPAGVDDAYIVGTPSGAVFASMDRPIHTCASLEQRDGVDAMRRIAEMVSAK